MAGERLAKQGKDIVFEAGDLSAFSDGDFAAVGDDALERGKANEGVAADLLAAFDRLQEETFALLPGCGMRLESSVRPVNRLNCWRGCAWRLGFAGLSARRRRLLRCEV